LPFFTTVNARYAGFVLLAILLSCCLLPCWALPKDLPWEIGVKDARLGAAVGGGEDGAGVPVCRHP